ncbi:hypothetical protein D3C74_146720 [compost metagenome]
MLFQELENTVRVICRSARTCFWLNPWTSAFHNPSRSHAVVQLSTLNVTSCLKVVGLPRGLPMTWIYYALLPQSMLMNANNGHINHHTFEVRFNRNKLQNPIPNSNGFPVAEPGVHRGPRRIIACHVAPCRSSPGDPQHRFEHHTIVRSSLTFLFFSFWWHHVFNPFPLDHLGIVASYFLIYHELTLFCSLNIHRRRMYPIHS